VPMPALRRHLLTIILAAAAMAPATAAAADCPGADQRPSSGADLRAATVCLLNAERTARGLQPLTEHPALDSAAAGWSTRQVNEGFFAHETADSTLTQRLTDAGYFTSTKWRAGENLAWGELDRARPVDIVKDWMASDGHRANVLDPGFRDVGIGIALGRPGAPSSDAATFTADFGVLTAAAPPTTATVNQDDGSDAPAVKPAAPAKTTKAKTTTKAAKAPAKKKATLRGTRGRSAQDWRRRRLLRKTLRMTAFASHQRAATAAAVGLHQR
jgi:uncharacterized protein YkwD